MCVSIDNNYIVLNINQIYNNIVSDIITDIAMIDNLHAYLLQKIHPT